MGTSIIPVRWRFFSVIFILSFLSYMLRQHFPVAGEFMMKELAISELQMGWVYGAFFWGYLVFQIPGGILGKRFGPRLTLLVAGGIWVLACLLFALLPGSFESSVVGTVGLLIAIRVLMGAAHAPIYPVQAAAVERWFPVGQWALPNAVSSTGLSLGAAAAAPIFSIVILNYGWRASFLVFIPVGFLFFWIWWWYARDNPREHPAMSGAELEKIEAHRSALTQDAGYRAWRQPLGHRETLLLASAYFTHNFVFYSFATWFFHYLVNVLGFSIIESGMLAAAPWLLGAAAATVGGWICDTLCHRLRLTNCAFTDARRGGPGRLHALQPDVHWPGELGRSRGDGVEAASRVRRRARGSSPRPPGACAPASPSPCPTRTPLHQWRSAGAARRSE